LQSVKSATGEREPPDGKGLPNYATATLAASVHPVGGFPAPVIDKIVATPGSTDGSFDISWLPQFQIIGFVIDIFGQLFNLSATQTKFSFTSLSAPPWVITLASREKTTKSLIDWTQISYSPTASDASAVTVSMPSATSLKVDWTSREGADSHTVNLYQQGATTSTFLRAAAVPIASGNTYTFTGLTKSSGLAAVVVASKVGVPAPLAGLISTPSPVPANATLLSAGQSALTVGSVPRTVRQGRVVTEKSKTKLKL
jgi:hypothetical protein